MKILIVLLFLGGCFCFVNGAMWNSMPYAIFPGNTTVPAAYFVPLSATDPTLALVVFQYTYFNFTTKFEIAWYTWSSNSSMTQLSLMGNYSLNVKDSYEGYSNTVKLIDQSVSYNGHPLMVIAFYTSLVIFDLWSVTEITITQNTLSGYPTTNIWFCPATPDLIFTNGESSRVYIVSISQQKVLSNTLFPGILTGEFMCIGSILSSKSCKRCLIILDTLFAGYGYCNVIQWLVKDFIATPNALPLFNFSVPDCQEIYPVPYAPNAALPLTLNAFANNYPEYYHGAFTLTFSDTAPPVVVSYVRNIPKFYVQSDAVPEANIIVGEYNVVRMDQGRTLITLQPPFPTVLEIDYYTYPPFGYQEFESMVAVPDAAKATFPFSFFFLHTINNDINSRFSVILPYK